MGALRADTLPADALPADALPAAALPSGAGIAPDSSARAWITASTAPTTPSAASGGGFFFASLRPSSTAAINARRMRARRSSSARARGERLDHAQTAAARAPRRAAPAAPRAPRGCARASRPAPRTPSTTTRAALRSRVVERGEKALFAVLEQRRRRSCATHPARDDALDRHARAALGRHHLPRRGEHPHPLDLGHTLSARRASSAPPGAPAVCPPACAPRVCHRGWTRAPPRLLLLRVFWFGFGLLLLFGFGAAGDGDLDVLLDLRAVLAGDRERHRERLCRTCCPSPSRGGPPRARSGGPRGTSTERADRRVGDRREVLEVMPFLMLMLPTRSTVTPSPWKTTTRSGNAAPP